MQWENFSVGFPSPILRRDARGSATFAAVGWARRASQAGCGNRTGERRRHIRWRAHGGSLSRGPGSDLGRLAASPNRHPERGCRSRCSPPISRLRDTDTTRIRRTLSSKCARALSYVLMYIAARSAPASRSARSYIRRIGRLCASSRLSPSSHWRSPAAAAAGARWTGPGPYPRLCSCLGWRWLTALGPIEVRQRPGTVVALFGRRPSCSGRRVIVIATGRLGRHRCAPARRRDGRRCCPCCWVWPIIRPSFAAREGGPVASSGSDPRCSAIVDDPQALIRISSGSGRPERPAPMLREHHLSVFAEAWSGCSARARRPCPPRRSTECRGGIDGIASVGTPTRRNGVRTLAWDAERRAVPPRVVIADAGGRVIGYGLSGFPKANGGAGGGWRGHFAAAPTVSVIA